MGRSVELLDKTYCHLAAGTKERARELLDACESGRLRRECVTN